MYAQCVVDGIEAIKVSKKLGSTLKEHTVEFGLDWYLKNIRINKSLWNWLGQINIHNLVIVFVRMITDTSLTVTGRSNHPPRTYKQAEPRKI